MLKASAVVCCAALIAAACTSGPGAPTASPDGADAPEATAPPDDAASPGTVETASPSPADDERSVPPERPLSSTKWTALAPAPLALTEVAAAAVGGQIWVVGGFEANGQPVDAVQIYTPAVDTWEEGPALPQPLHHASVVAAPDAVYVIGGYTDGGFSAPTAAVHRFDLASGAWEEGPALPEPRAAGAGAWDGSRVVYGGGVGPGGVSADVLALAEGDWGEVGQLSSAREHLGAASDAAGSVWFLGGRVVGLDANLPAVDLVEGDQVTRAADLPTARGGAAGFWSPETGACLVGGESPQGTFAEVECVSAEGEAVTLPSLGEPRHGLGAAVADGIAYALLGGPAPGLSVSDTVEALLVTGR